MRRSVVRKGRLARALTVGAILAAAGGCAPAHQPTSEPSISAAIEQPSGPAVLGIDWAGAASVDAPDNFNGDAEQPPYEGLHPILRIPGQAIMADVVSRPAGGLVAVGYVPPDWVPAAWTSSDGLDWSLHAIGNTGFTFMVSLATGADGSLVAVGRSGQVPVAWTSVDGVAWTQQPVPVLGGAGVAERMTAVVAGRRGYVAGGSVGPELMDRHARFWTSNDGLDWGPVADDPDAFANSEVRAITTFGDAFVAVGVVGTEQKHSGAVAWTSGDGLRWTRVDDPSFVDGIAVAVVAAPFGGLVAVGSDVERKAAVAWTSPDGHHWKRAPSEASFEDPGYVWMTDVCAIGDSVVAIGGYQPLQRGTGTSWVSRDGIHWDQARSAPVQEQVDLYAITPGGPGAIAVGAFGGPDSYAPRVLLTPGR